MKIKILIGAELFLLLFVFPAFAFSDKKPEFRFSQLYRYDPRQDNHQLYSSRLSLTFNYLDKKEKHL